MDAGEDDEVQPQWVWVWDGGFVMADAKMRGSQVVTEKPSLISVAGRFCSPRVDYRTVNAQERLAEDATRKINSAGTTYEFDEQSLLVVSMQIWDSLAKDSVPVDALPMVPSSTRGGVPYLFEGMLAVLIKFMFVNSDRHLSFQGRLLS